MKFIFIFVVIVSFSTGCLSAEEVAGQVSVVGTGVNSSLNAKLMNVLSPLDDGFSGPLMRSSKESPKWFPIIHESDLYVDLIFLLDGSGSVGKESFSILKEWIKNITLSFNLSNGKFQIGVVQYSHWYRLRPSSSQKYMKTEIELGSCLSHSCLESKLKKVKLMGFTTFTGHAITKTVNEDFANSKNFANSTKILVLVTDGRSNDDVVRAAAYARSNGITIFCIGIAKYDLLELQLIATGERFNNLQIYQLKQYEELPLITHSLQREIRSYYINPVCPPLRTMFWGNWICTNLNNVGSYCAASCEGDPAFKVIGNSTRVCQVTPFGVLWSGKNPTCGACDKKFDLLFILDSSSSVTFENFERMKQFVSLIVESFSIGPENVQISCIRYNQHVRNEFDYSTYNTKVQVLDHLKGISYAGKGTMTGKALKYVLENEFETMTGRRTYLPHVTVLITDGKARDNVLEYARQLQLVSRVIAIGLKNADFQEILDINSDPDLPDHLHILPSYLDLLRMNKLIETVKRICQTITVYNSTECKPIEETVGGTVSCSSKDPKLSSNDTDSVVRYPVGTNCTMTCDSGFVKIGKQSARCNYRGRWTKSEWGCVEKTCEMLESTSAGVSLLCENGKPFCTSRCKPGYESSGNYENCEGLGEGELHLCFHTCIKTPGKDPVLDSALIQCKYTGECFNSTCDNGLCTKREDGIFCLCEPGFTGEFCQKETNECKPGTCKKGQCEDLGDGFKCICDGEVCDERIDCDSNPCLNSGKCQSLPDGFLCQCTENFTGERCQIGIDGCDDNPCLHGRCSSNPLGYSCDCNPGYTGNKCEIDINDCADEPCGNHGVCEQDINSFRCECHNGYSGKFCETNIDDCDNNLCKNNGQCVDQINDYSCKCQAGYEGQFCQTDINECDPNPCQNGGDCQDGVDSFTCDCKLGYAGSLCENVIDYCHNEPCLNGGNCISEIGGYSCVCQPGFADKNCSSDIDECSLSPPICKNKGKCSNKHGGFTCACVGRFWGNVCDQKLCNLPILTSDLGSMSCSDENRPGSVCELQCPVGWRVKNNGNGRRRSFPSLELTCSPDGFWSNSSFLRRETENWECEAVQCPVLEDISFGGILPFSEQTDQESMVISDTDNHVISCTNGTNVGSICSLRCHTSFAQNVAFTKKCLPDGMWNGPRWRCVQNKCMEPIALGNYREIVCTKGYSVGSTCRLECIPNFKPFGDQSKKCLGNYSWSPDHRWGCREEKCPAKLPEIRNGQFFCSDRVRPGSICEVRCDHGFVLLGKGSVICDERGLEMAWIGEVGRCILSDCDFTIDLKSGISQDSTPPNLVSILREPYREERESQVQQNGEKPCNMRAIVAINVTKTEKIKLQLWYGNSVAGYHTVISTSPNTEGYEADTTVNEFLVTAIGQRLFTSGFTDKTLRDVWITNNVKQLPLLVQTSSQVDVTLGLDHWSWKSHLEMWEGNILRKNTTEESQVVFLGLNRVPNEEYYYDYYRNGTGLCYLCLQRDLVEN